MQREDHSCEQCAGHREPPQDEHNERGRHGVQRDVRQMVAEERVSPQPMLEPERGVQQRIVLLRRADLGPDAPQTPKRTQVRRRDVAGVVPQRATVECRKIRDENRNRKNNQPRIVGSPFLRA